MVGTVEVWDILSFHLTDMYVTIGILPGTVLTLFSQDELWKEVSVVSVSEVDLFAS